MAKGYLSEAGPYFNEANVDGLAYATIVPVIADVSTRTHNTLVLHRERGLAATDFRWGL